MTKPEDTVKTILIVDDDVGLTFLLREVVELFGYDVAVAHSGPEAEAMVRDGETVDLLLTDIGLKQGFDGFELARRVHDLRPSIPTVYISGNADYADAEKGPIEAPILQKPVPPSELQTALDLALRG